MLFSCSNHSIKQGFGQYKTLDKPGLIFTGISDFCGMIGIVRAQNHQDEREGFAAPMLFSPAGLPQSGGTEKKNEGPCVYSRFGKNRLYIWRGQGGMFENYNQAINFVIVVILTVSPHFFEEHGLKVEDARYIYAAAQRQAAHIIETGDASALAGLAETQAELEKYRPVFERLAPVLDRVAAHLGPGFEEPPR
jgi:hypothetical protein